MPSSIDDTELEGDEEQFIPQSRELVRTLRSIRFEAYAGGRIDTKTISPEFYNRFNFSLIPGGKSDVKLTLGITSARKGDGKSLVASNLAVSLAIANERPTVLVDINFDSPTVHKTFGTNLTPGLSDALMSQEIYVKRTKISHLGVVPAGSREITQLGFGSTIKDKIRPLDVLGIERLSMLRDVFYSLRQQFDFTIVDMPAMWDPRIPSLLAQQMDGLILVINTGQTKQEEVERLIDRVDARHVLGFVFNRYGLEGGSS
jgi:protein-tyrosine kinase